MKEEQINVIMPVRTVGEEDFTALIGKRCVFITYETRNGAGKMVMLYSFYTEKMKKIMKLLKKVNITYLNERIFKETDIPLWCKGDENGKRG